MSGVATLTSSATAIVPRDLMLGRADTVVTTPSGPRAAEDSGVVDIVVRGVGGVRGTVQTLDGRPLANAIVGQVVTLVRAQVIDTVKVRANAIARTALGRTLTAFGERRRQGLGRFFGPADLEAMRLFRVTDVLRTVPGVWFELSGGADFVIRMHGFSSRCVPTLFVDRMRMPGTGALDSFLPPDFVAAVEVYRAGVAPAEFQDIFSGCGSIVVWTGAGR